MTEIKEIVDSIMNPERDCLDLFKRAEKYIYDFMKKYAIDPKQTDY